MATRLFMVTAAGGEQRFRGREQVCRPRAVEDGVNEQIKASTWRTERGLSGKGKERGVGRRGREAVEGEMRSSRRQHRCCGRQRGPPAQSFLCPTHAAQAGPAPTI